MPVAPFVLYRKPWLLCVRLARRHAGFTAGQGAPCFMQKCGGSVLDFLRFLMQCRCRVQPAAAFVVRSVPSAPPS